MIPWSENDLNPVWKTLTPSWRMLAEKESRPPAHTGSIGKSSLNKMHTTTTTAVLSPKLSEIFFYFMFSGKETPRLNQK